MTMMTKTLMTTDNADPDSTNYFTIVTIIVTTTENAKTEYDIQCDLELVETIPLSLKKGGFAKKMVVEHKSILQV